MAKINVSEADFGAVAAAALGAKHRKDPDAAAALDKLARKINAALTNAKYSRLARRVLSEYKPMSWQEVPSVLDSPYARSGAHE